jgi:NhaC family Na+:H+ antiporter
MVTDDASAAPKQQERSPTLTDSLIPVVALLVLLISSFLLFGDAASSGPNQIALLTCGLIAIAVAMKNKLRWKDLRAAALEGVASGLASIFILLAVGALIGTWAMSGTIVAMVYYGMEILNPQYFYASAALLCAVVAFSIGSSWTTAGTLGIGLMGIAANMGLLACLVPCSAAL